MHTTRLRPMMIVDVFTQTPYMGNPVTVVLDGQGLSSAQMLAFTRWTKLSEATFVLPASDTLRAQGADYCVRIFSPAGEMDFAGHPTLGTCHAWLAHGGQPQHAARIVQAGNAGLIPIQRSAQGLAFAAPAVRTRSLPQDMHRIYEALQLPNHHVIAAEMLDVGTPWLCIHVNSTATLTALRPQASALQALATLFDDDVGIGLCAFPEHSPAGVPPSAQLDVRAFTLSGEEDPVTGSLNACLADWLSARHLLEPPYLARQGRSVDRDGLVSLERDANQQLWVGGHSVLCVQGMVHL